jgi:hypothetical protein
MGLAVVATGALGKNTGAPLPISRFQEVFTPKFISMLKFPF